MKAQSFDRQSLEEALCELGRRASAEGKTIEIAIYGGSALMLAYAWRVAMRDVDAVFEADRETVRRFAGNMAEERGWDRHWLNDGVQGFLSPADPTSKTLFRTYPSEQEPGLRVMLACPRYLFAMKSRAMRISGVESSSDMEDIHHRAAEIGIPSAQEALDLVARFYPNHLIQPKTRFALEEIFDNLSELRTPGP